MVLMKSGSEPLYEDVGDDWVVIDGFEVKSVCVHFSRAHACDEVHVPSLVTGDSLGAFRVKLIEIAKKLVTNADVPFHIPGHRFAQEALDRVIAIVEERLASERAAVLSTTYTYIETTADAALAMKSLREEKSSQKKTKKPQTQKVSAAEKRLQEKRQKNALSTLSKMKDAKETATRLRDAAKRASAKAVRKLKQASVDTRYAVDQLEEAAGNPSVLSERGTDGAPLTRVDVVRALLRAGGEATTARSSTRFLAETDPAGDGLLPDIRGLRLVGLELWAPPVEDETIWEKIRVLKFSINHHNAQTGALAPYQVQYLKSSSGDRREGGADNIEWWEEEDFTAACRIPRRSNE